MHLIWGYGKELKWETTLLWLQRLCLVRVLTDPGPSRYRPPDSGAVWGKQHPQSPGWLPDPPKDAHDGLHPCIDKQIALFCQNAFNSQYAIWFTVQDQSVIPLYVKKNSWENNKQLKSLLDWYLNLPNESYPVSDIFWRMTYAQRKHDPGLWADPCHTWGKLSRWTCRRHDGRQGTAEQRASRLNQLRLVLITPLLVHTQTGERGGRHIHKRMKREKTDSIPLSRQRN